MQSLATQSDVTVIHARLGFIHWVMAFQAALILAMAARLFGIV